ncbi:MAG: transcriptional regulator [Synechococcaceae cyanobacterium SM2_3_2]|nr:transcriptional regulator [Synechococcaceae cyanobacterium SM2_3_2]
MLRFTHHSRLRPASEFRRSTSHKHIGLLVLYFSLLCVPIHSLSFAQESLPSPALISKAIGLETLRIPPYVARFGRSDPIIVVVGENTFTELTDYVVPFGVFSESGVTQVFALATKAGPMQMFPALRIQPQKTTSEFDIDFPQGADYVIVPAVHKPNDPDLIQWVLSQAKKGATIVGICDGVWVVANGGLLTGRRAVGHWFSFDRLIKRFPETTFVKNRRYISDEQVITTTGVTASVPVSIALIEAIAGRSHAAAIAQSLGIQNWSTSHPSQEFHLSVNHIFTAAKNWLSFWSHETVGIPIASGIDEISLALVSDAISRTYRSSAYTLAASVSMIETKHGLLVIPDRTTQPPKRSDRTIELPISGLRSAESLDWCLSHIATIYGSATSAFVALQLEYPKQ